MDYAINEGFGLKLDRIRVLMRGTVFFLRFPRTLHNPINRGLTLLKPLRLFLPIIHIIPIPSLSNIPTFIPPLSFLQFQYPGSLH